MKRNQANAHGGKRHGAGRKSVFQKTCPSGDALNVLEELWGVEGLEAWKNALAVKFYWIELRIRQERALARGLVDSGLARRMKAAREAILTVGNERKITLHDLGKAGDAIYGHRSVFGRPARLIRAKGQGNRPKARADLEPEHQAAVDELAHDHTLPPREEALRELEQMLNAERRDEAKIRLNKNHGTHLVKILEKIKKCEVGKVYLGLDDTES